MSDLPMTPPPTEDAPVVATAPAGSPLVDTSTSLAAVDTSASAPPLSTLVTPPPAPEPKEDMVPAEVDPALLLDGTDSSIAPAVPPPPPPPAAVAPPAGPVAASVPQPPAPPPPVQVRDPSAAVVNMVETMRADAKPSSLLAISSRAVHHEVDPNYPLHSDVLFHAPHVLATILNDRLPSALMLLSGYPSHTTSKRLIIALAHLTSAMVNYNHSHFWSSLRDASNAVPAMSDSVPSPTWNVVVEYMLAQIRVQFVDKTYALIEKMYVQIPVTDAAEMLGLQREQMLQDVARFSWKHDVASDTLAPTKYSAKSRPVQAEKALKDLADSVLLLEQH